MTLLAVAGRVRKVSMNTQCTCFSGRLANDIIYFHFQLQLESYLLVSENNKN